MAELYGAIIERVKPVHIDKRGYITDILNQDLKHVGIVGSEVGAIRGNHYHKTSIQYTYVLSGKFEVLLAKAESPEEVKRVVLGAGQLITIPPFIIHRFSALEKSVFIEMDSKSRSGNRFEEDVIRVPIQKNDNT